MITLVEARSDTLDAATVWMKGNNWLSDMDGAAKTGVHRDADGLSTGVCSVLLSLSQALLLGSRLRGAGG
ncbi:MAG: hypothetical protein IOB84_15085 [Brevundimonas sp.]|jgi:hypothetical protein|nr:hypothetical protein [Brevundimonas sp.]